MPRNNVRFVFLALPIILLGAIGFVYFRHLSSSRPLTVFFENVREVRVVDVSEEQTGGKEKQLAVVKKSGDTVRINKNASVFVRYIGAPGFADGFENGSTTTVSIKPDYSTQKIKDIIGQQQAQIRDAIFSNIQNGLSYSLSEGTLFDHGRWYISTLVPANNPENEADTLRVLLKQSDSSWQMASAPRLVFTKFNTKNIPVAVLDAANTYSAD